MAILRGSWRIQLSDPQDPKHFRHMLVSAGHADFPALAEIDTHAADHLRSTQTLLLSAIQQQRQCRREHVRLDARFAVMIHRH